MKRPGVVQKRVKPTRRGRRVPSDRIPDGSNWSGDAPVAVREGNFDLRHAPGPAADGFRSARRDEASSPLRKRPGAVQERVKPTRPGRRVPSDRIPDGSNWSGDAPVSVWKGNFDLRPAPGPAAGGFRSARRDEASSPLMKRPGAVQERVKPTRRGRRVPSDRIPDGSNWSGDAPVAVREGNFDLRPAPGPAARGFRSVRRDESSAPLMKRPGVVQERVKPTRRGRRVPSNRIPDGLNWSGDAPVAVREGNFDLRPAPEPAAGGFRSVRRDESSSPLMKRPGVVQKRVKPTRRGRRVPSNRIPDGLNWSGDAPVAVRKGNFDLPHAPIPPAGGFRSVLRDEASSPLMKRPGAVQKRARPTRRARRVPGNHPMIADDECPFSRETEFPRVGRKMRAIRSWWRVWRNWGTFPNSRDFCKFSLASTNRGPFCCPLLGVISSQTAQKLR